MVRCWLFTLRCQRGKQTSKAQLPFDQCRQGRAVLLGRGRQSGDGPFWRCRPVRPLPDIVDRAAPLPNHPCLGFRVARAKGGNTMGWGRGTVSDPARPPSHLQTGQNLPGPTSRWAPLVRSMPLRFVNPSASGNRAWNSRALLAVVASASSTAPFCISTLWTAPRGESRC